MAFLKILFALFFVFGLGFFILGFGRFDLTYAQIFSLFCETLANIGQENANFSSKEAFILFEVRLPRVLLAIIVGAGLGIAGASFQAIFRNPLASPDILNLALQGKIRILY